VRAHLAARLRVRAEQRERLDREHREDAGHDVQEKAAREGEQQGKKRPSARPGIAADTV
jgi:hypothetical protein